MKKVHFVGIGGIGMSGIAEVLLTMGFTVTGSDVRENAVTESLKSHGATIFLGHDARNVRGSNVAVYSSAVSPGNPELLEARRLNIPVIPRAEMLAELMRMKSSVAVSGSHGKTTVTAMIAHCAHEAGLDPTVVIGGRLSTLKASARLGRSDLLVAEADESDRSFLLLFPTLAVITNIDWEHVDCYPDIKDLQGAFLDFANRVPFYGAIVACSDDRNLRQLLPKFRRRVVTYGESGSAGYRATPLSSGPQGERFKVTVRGEERGEIRLRQVGRHVMLNATAAVAACEEIGIPFEKLAASLAGFPGADRRFEFKGEASNVRVVDDYGHHPTEIRATLEAARKVAGKGRVVVLFQPHRYTRLKAMMDGFAQVLMGADVAVVTEVYAASEPAIEGVTGEALVARLASLGHKNVHYCPGVASLPSLVRPLLRGGDLVVTLGAGTITTVGEALLSLLEEEGAGG